MTNTVPSIPNNVTHELLPFERDFHQALDQLPTDARIAITSTEALPKVDVTSTVNRAEEAYVKGYEHLVPHIAARALESEGQLFGLMDRLGEIGVTEVFVVGGDRDANPKTKLSDGFHLLSAMTTRESTIETVGIPGYPRGHHSLPENVTWHDLRKKQDLGREHGLKMYVETQFDFDAQGIVAWLKEHMIHGVDMPVQIGVFGAVGYKKGLRALQLNGGPLKAKEFMNNTGLGTHELITGSHVDRSLGVASGIVDASQKLKCLPEIRGFTINTLNDVEHTLQRFGPLYESAAELEVTQGL